MLESIALARMDFKLVSLSIKSSIDLELESCVRQLLTRLFVAARMVLPPLEGVVVQRVARASAEFLWARKVRPSPWVLDAYRFLPPVITTLERTSFEMYSRRECRVHKVRAQNDGFSAYNIIISIKW